MKVTIFGTLMLQNRIKYFLILLVSSLPFLLKAQWQITGGLYPPYVHVPSVSSGLSSVYVLYGMQNSRIIYQAPSEAPITCFRYEANALDAVAVKGHQDGSRFIIEQPEAGFGYFVRQEEKTLSYIWLIDYLPSLLTMKSITADLSASDCDQVRLLFDRDAPDISFSWINGKTETLPRKFMLSRNTLRWNENDLNFEEITLEEEVTGYREMTLQAPYVNTTFSITGDQFLRYWNIPLSLTSELYETPAVTGEAFAEQHIREAGNEIDKESGELGGSAPVDISFTGYANYPVTTYQAWEISRDPEFDIIEATYTDQNLEYSFEEEGTTYVRFVISNATGVCEKVVQTFTVNTSESMLKVPNVFTPQSASGNNQVFKVVYKSIIRFEGRVFNRWGNQLFHWTDPSQGWDGTVNGKLVPTGAYYYLIDAEGVGGKKYKLKGDINVLRTKN
ncbi:MAG: gliding motility-associated C-terminal domain-containing protein [Bacteroidales bacterium]